MNGKNKLYFISILILIIGACMVICGLMRKKQLDNTNDYNTKKKCIDTHLTTNIVAGSVLFLTAAYMLCTIYKYPNKIKFGF